MNWVNSLSTSVRGFPWASERGKELMQQLKKAESSKMMHDICMMDVDTLGLNLDTIGLWQNNSNL